MVLLDVNALLALCWPSHMHSREIHRWFEKHHRSGWATCALTQSGFIRVSTQPTFAGRVVTIDEAQEVLERATAQLNHRALPLLDSFADVHEICTGGIVGHRQVTDAWLLASAIAAGAKLLTFDQGIGALLASATERSQHLITLRA